MSIVSLDSFLNVPKRRRIDVVIVSEFFQTCGVRLCMLLVRPYLHETELIVDLLLRKIARVPQAFKLKEIVRTTRCRRRLDRNVRRQARWRKIFNKLRKFIVIDESVRVGVERAKKNVKILRRDRNETSQRVREFRIGQSPVAVDVQTFELSTQISTPRLSAAAIRARFQFGPYPCANFVARLCVGRESHRRTRRGGRRRRSTRRSLRSKSFRKEGDGFCRRRRASRHVRTTTSC